jgi:putative acetyltransferase
VARRAHRTEGLPGTLGAGQGERGNPGETSATYTLGVDQQHSSITIAVEAPRQPEVERLLDGSSAYAQSLYPPESNFLLDIATLERPEVAFYVARDGERAVGIAALVIDAETATDAPARGELKRMFVDPAARGRGVAGALLTRIEADASARGIGEIVLETGDLHDAAKVLYARHGYREIPQFGQYVGEPHSVCFAKPLGVESSQGVR